MQGKVARGLKTVVGTDGTCREVNTLSWDVKNTAKHGGEVKVRIEDSGNLDCASFTVTTSTRVVALDEEESVKLTNETFYPEDLRLYGPADRRVIAVYFHMNSDDYYVPIVDGATVPDVAATLAEL